MAKGKMSIPEVRTRLRELAEEHEIDELKELANELYRSPAVTRAPRRSQRLTPGLAAEIRQYARRHPAAHQQDVANHFGVNHGRVSQALNYEK